MNGQNPAAPRRSTGRRGITRATAVRIAVVAWMTLVWVFLWGTVSVANILSGLVVSVGILVLLPLPRVPVEGRFHLWPALKLAGVIVVEALQSSFAVAWLSIRPQAPPPTGVLRCKLDLDSDLVLTLWADIMNNIPGTMVLQIDRERRIVYVHVLDVGTDAAVDQFHRSVRRIESLLKDAFERDSEWQPGIDIDTTPHEPTVTPDDPDGDSDAVSATDSIDHDARREQDR